METVQRVATGRPVTTLRWEGDDLVDFAEGPDRWRLDGTTDIPAIRQSFGSPFDQGLVSPSGRFRAVYAERGTKALLLHDGRIVRELNRSFYHAPDYDYPIALGTLPNGREIVVHCPDAYNELHIDDADTGQRLTAGPRSPSDTFHSRLSISPDGRHLLVAGWFWHPCGTARIFDLEHAVADASVLDGPGILPLYEGVNGEAAAACWLDADRVVVATTDNEPFDAAETSGLGPQQLGVWSISESHWLHRTPVGYPIGTLIACGSRVITLHGHPKLLDPATGTVIAEWPAIPVAAKNASYGVAHIPTPITALHPDGKRLAIAEPDGIAVLTLPSS